MSHAVSFSRLVFVIGILFLGSPHEVKAGVLFGTDGNLGGGFRWDAAPKTVNGIERSLDGGLRYSLQGGSYQAYRDLFSWNSVPSVPDFTVAIQQAFAAWTVVDPATNLSSSLSFVADFATPVVGTSGFGGLNINMNGAEIDLFGVAARDSRTRGVAGFSFVPGNVTLTSGTPNYGGGEGGGAIIGADVYINANSGAIYSLDFFRRLLTHELGHAIGLGDVEDTFQNGFIDDNYDGTSNATVQVSLNNTWALLVNPLNPAASAGLSQFASGTVGNGAPGLESPGVDLLMETEGLGIAPGNPVTNLTPLTNDDYGMRQFLYPSQIPEPSGIVLLALAMAIRVGVSRTERGHLRVISTAPIGLATSS